MSDYAENFGLRLRKLRTDKSAPMTQEKLAEKLGISPQAVSRWENGATMPDVPLIPEIAGIFGVTTDYLLGVDARSKNGQIKAIIARAMGESRSNSAKDAEEHRSALMRSIKVLREGLERYPGDFELTMELGHALSEYGITQNFAENGGGRAMFEEAISLMDHIVEKCADEDKRISAKLERVYLYGYLKRDDDVKKYAGELPLAYASRELALVEALNNTESVRAAAQECIPSCFNMMFGVTSTLQSLKNKNGEFVFTPDEQIEISYSFIRAYEAIYRDDCRTEWNSYLLTLAYLRIANVELRRRNVPEGIKALCRLTDIIMQPFEEPDRTGGISLFIHEPDTEQIRSASSIIAKNMLKLLNMDSRFDAARDDESFKKIVERLASAPSGEDNRCTTTVMTDDDSSNKE